jgi:hypothetical protein
VRIGPIVLILATIGACSLFNREGPAVTCQDLAGGAINDCRDGILASCDGAKVTYQVCDLKSACEQPWQTPGAYRCNVGDPLKTPTTDGGTVSGGGLTPNGKPCGPSDVCVVGTTGDSPVSAFTIHGGEVNFTDGRTVWRAPRAGGFSTALGTDNLDPNGGIAADDTYAYVAQTNAKRILRLKGGGVKEYSAAGAPGALLMSHLRIDETRIYWIEDGVSQRLLRAANKDGSSTVDLAGGDELASSALHISGGFLYWDTGGASLARVPASATSKTTPSAVELGSGTNDRLSTFAVDDSGIFFALHDVDGNAIWRAQSDGTGRTKIADLDDVEQASGMATSEQRVYWVDSNRGGVRRLAKSGGTPETVNSAGSAFAARIPVLADELYVYWAEGPRVMRGPK